VSDTQSRTHIPAPTLPLGSPPYPRRSSRTLAPNGRKPRLPLTNDPPTLAQSHTACRIACPRSPPVLTPGLHLTLSDGVTLTVHNPQSHSHSGNSTRTESKSLDAQEAEAMAALDKSRSQEEALKTTVTEAQSLFDAAQEKLNAAKVTLRYVQMATPMIQFLLAFSLLPTAVFPIIDLDDSCVVQA
jgi:hypothetical protein